MTKQASCYPASCCALRYLFAVLELWQSLTLCQQQHDFACMQLLHEFGQAVWKLSWSVTGGILAVSDSKGTVSLWKEAIDGQWQQISQDVAAA